MVAWMLDRSGQSLQIRLQQDTPQGGAGDLVEVRSASTLYLGEVQRRTQDILAIEVEHSIDLETLEAIQRVWQRPVGD